MNDLLSKRIRQSMLALCSFAALFWSATLLAATVSDAGITAAVQQEFLRDEAVPFNRIDVETEDGIVTLTGRVADLAARQQAERLTGIVKGVRACINRIEVEAMGVTPDELAANVRAAWKADPATDEYEIDIRADKTGGITFEGSVDSWAEKKLVETVAMTVPGVTKVDNRLTVEEGPVYGAESEIADHIKGRLRWDVRVDDSLINVLVREGGRVTLSGTVGSLAEKQHAEQLAWIQNVRSVDATHLNVERWARDDDLRRGKYEVESDEQIRAALLRAFEYDPRVLSAPIDARVESGTVWLQGSVSDLLAKKAAERDAHNTVGVLRVVNLLKVRPEIRTDDAISQGIVDTLHGKGMLDDNEIRVSVSAGEVWLTGDVDTALEYWAADRAASAQRGVEELHNDLSVRGRTPTFAAYSFGSEPRPVAAARPLKTDREIYANIRSELYWSPFVDEDSVTVEVHDGIATLSGTVASLRELRAANENAIEGGANTVRSYLDVTED